MALLLFLACTEVLEALAVVEVAVGLVSAMLVIFKFLNESFTFLIFSGHNSKEKKPLKVCMVANFSIHATFNSFNLINK